MLAWFWSDYLLSRLSTNGWAYEITDNATGKTLWFQDSDAVQVQNATEDFDNTDALLDYFECIDQ
jgi:hypothetical protein